MDEKKKGILYAFLCYSIWGVIPLYWKLLNQFGSLQILCFRIVWSLLFVGLYIVLTKKGGPFLSDIKNILKNWKLLLQIILASILVSLNWLTYIYSVNAGYVTEASLGYYINPLMNILLSLIFLKEKLSRSGIIACLCALAGVSYLIFETGVFPWQSFALAITFSLYGLIKKNLTIHSYSSLFIETLIMTPIALFYLVLFSPSPFQYSLPVNLLCMGAGIVTAIPLLLFSEAAQRVSYIVLGFIQYICPTILLLTAIFIYHEPYSVHQFIGFMLIWIGILIFSLPNIVAYRKNQLL